MKQSYNIEVSGVNLNIVSSDDAQFVESTVAELETSVQNMLRVGKNYSKLDALILCALDYLGEYRKAEAKIKNLEAQIAILEAGRRTVKTDAPAQAEPVQTVAEEPAAEPETTSVPEVADDGSARDAKFRQLEAFLGSQLKLDIDDDQ